MSAWVSRGNRPVSSVKMPIASPSRAMRSRTTMSSAPKLAASEAGEWFFSMPASRRRARPTRSSSVFGVTVVGQPERVEAAAREIEEVVAADVAEGAQLAAVAEARAQQRGGGEAAAVAELGEVHRDLAEPLEVGGEIARFVIRLEPH